MWFGDDKAREHIPASKVNMPYEQKTSIRRDFQGAVSSNLSEPLLFSLPCLWGGGAVQMSPKLSSGCSSSTEATFHADGPRPHLWNQVQQVPTNWE